MEINKDDFINKLEKGLKELNIYYSQQHLDQLW